VLRTHKVNGAFAVLVVNQDVTTGFDTQVPGRISRLRQPSPSALAVLRKLRRRASTNPLPGPSDITTIVISAGAVFPHSFISSAACPDTPYVMQISANLALTNWLSVSTCTLIGNTLAPTNLIRSGTAQ
jgi:hypothetical protein